MSESTTYPGVVLVTGGAAGMGAHHARTLAARGSHVCIADVSDSSGVVDDIVAQTNRAEPDIVLLGGDYVAHVLGRRDVPPEAIAASLGKLKSRHGIFAYWCIEIDAPGVPLNGESQMSSAAVRRNSNGNVTGNLRF